jgi:hypothetical protein
MMGPRAADTARRYSPESGENEVDVPQPRKPTHWPSHPGQWPHALQVTVLLVLIGLLLWAISVLLGPDQAFIIGAAGFAAKLICMALDLRSPVRSGPGEGS